MTKINIEEVKCITGHTSSVNSLLLLNDKRVASCSFDNIIRIYDTSNDYHCDQVIKRHKKGISSICELDDGTIVSCSKEHSIMIGNFIIKNPHNDWVYKVIALPNNRIASCSIDMKIKIWKSVPPYTIIPIKVLEGHTFYVTSLLYIKERDLILMMEHFICGICQHNYFKGLKCCSPNSLYQIDKDIVIVGGMDTFYIMNIDKCVIKKTIKDRSFGTVHCFLKLRDNKTILCGCGKGTFCFYDMNTEKYRIMKNNHNETINDLLMIDDNTFLSYSNKSIKGWNY